MGMGSRKAAVKGVCQVVVACMGAEAEREQARAAGTKDAGVDEGEGGEGACARHQTEAIHGRLQPKLEVHRCPRVSCRPQARWPLAWPAARPPYVSHQQQHSTTDRNVVGPQAWAL